MGLIEVERALTKLGRPVFTTQEIAAVSGRSASAVVQTLAQLERAGIVSRIRRGLWRDARREMSPFDVVPFLAPNKTLYVSFTSALHLHGVIEQIPQTITVATLSHARTVRTTVGTYRLHQVCPELFDGFDWYTPPNCWRASKGTGSFLIASPAKALVDCLYISGRKRKSFASFPELDLTRIDAREARQWIARIPSPRLQRHASDRLAELLE